MYTEPGQTHVEMFTVSFDKVMSNSESSLTLQLWALILTMLLVLGDNRFQLYIVSVVFVVGVQPHCDLKRRQRKEYVRRLTTCPIGPVFTKPSLFLTQCHKRN